MNWLSSPILILISSLWYFINGVLHDVFVLRRHKGPYDRDLLRLLMDGHVLLLSGIVLFVCYLMVQDKIEYGYVISLIIGSFMLVYCAMIYPFLKSIFTIIITLVLIASSIIGIG